MWGLKVKASERQFSGFLINGSMKEAVHFPPSLRRQVRDLTFLQKMKNFSFVSSAAKSNYHARQNVFILVLPGKVSTIGNRIAFVRNVRGSSKGRTGVFGTSNLGSNPSPRAIQKASLPKNGKAFFLKLEGGRGKDLRELVPSETREILAPYPTSLDPVRTNLFN